MGQWEITPIFKDDFNNDIIYIFRTLEYLSIYFILKFLEMFMDRMYRMLWSMHNILWIKKVVISLGRFRYQVSHIRFWLHFKQCLPKNCSNNSKMAVAKLQYVCNHSVYCHQSWLKNIGILIKNYLKFPCLKKDNKNLPQFHNSTQ